jgi:hypothetical protein
MRYHKDEMTGHTIEITGGSLVWCALILVIFFKVIPTIEEKGVKDVALKVWCGGDLKCKEELN